MEEIVSDFERARWNAAETAFPEVTALGCSFHWCQAVFRRIQKLGVLGLYRKNTASYRVCRKLLTLNLLSAAKIYKIFAKIQENAFGLLKPLCSYIYKQWINSNCFPPSTWSVFNQPIRTNNDAEGWHNRMNHKANNRADLPLYELILGMKKKET